MFHLIIYRYEELVTSGEVLSGQQLDEMSSCLSNLPADESFFALNSQDDVDDNSIKEDIENIEKQLQKLKMQRDQISLQKIEIRTDLQNGRERIKNQEFILSQAQQSVLNSCLSHQTAIHQLSTSVDDIANFFKNFSEVSNFKVFYINHLVKFYV